MSGFRSEIVYALNIDLSNSPTQSPMLVENGDLLIGSTIPNIYGSTVAKGNIVSPNGTLTVGYTSPNITLDLNSSAVYKSLSPYIVGDDVHSDYSSIQAAIDAAVAAGASSSNPANIYVKPKSGGYTENLTLADGINLIGFNSQTKITGEVTFSTLGKASIRGVQIVSGFQYGLIISGTDELELIVENCYLYNRNTNFINYINSNAATSVSLINCLCESTADFIAFMIGGHNGLFVFQNSSLIGNSSTASLNSSGGTLRVINSYLESGVGSGVNCICTIENSVIKCSGSAIPIVQSSTNAMKIYSSNMSGNGGAIASLSISREIYFYNCTLDCNNLTIVGAGIVYFSNVNFPGDSTFASNLETVATVASNDAIPVVSANSSPFNVKSIYGLVLARTDFDPFDINLPVLPVTGQKHKIKDKSGNAAVNNITITPAAGTIDGAPNFVINTNYGCVELIYNGTEWSVT